MENGSNSFRTNTLIIVLKKTCKVAVQKLYQTKIGYLCTILETVKTDENDDT